MLAILGNTMPHGERKRRGEHASCRAPSERLAALAMLEVIRTLQMNVRSCINFIFGDAIQWKEHKAEGDYALLCIHYEWLQDRMRTVVNLITNHITVVMNFIKCRDDVNAVDTATKGILRHVHALRRCVFETVFYAGDIPPDHCDDHLEERVAEETGDPRIDAMRSSFRTQLKRISEFHGNNFPLARSVRLNIVLASKYM